MIDLLSHEPKRSSWNEGMFGFIVLEKWLRWLTEQLIIFNDNTVKKQGKNKQNKVSKKTKTNSNQITACCLPVWKLKNITVIAGLKGLYKWPSRATEMTKAAFRFVHIILLFFQGCTCRHDDVFPKEYTTSTLTVQVTDCALRVIRPTNDRKSLYLIGPSCGPSSQQHHGNIQTSIKTLLLLSVHCSVQL